MEIKIEGLGKRFQHGWVIKDWSKHFVSNKTYGISGRNGSGKSTLLKMISGLLSPSKGTIHYFHNSSEIKREDIYRSVNIAAPYGELIEEYTLEEMVRFHTQFKQSGLLKDLADWILMMGLDQAAKRPIMQYSSGMKQRVKLGLAMYTKGHILILDEPTSNLDEPAKAWFFDHLTKQREDKIVFIASNEKEDFVLCDEVLQL